jgi:hypothetical protein
MNAAGIALFVFATTVNVSIVHQAVLTPPPRVVSPDPAPPHNLKPRVPPAELATPSATLARVAASILHGVLRDHGH